MNSDYSRFGWGVLQHVKIDVTVEHNWFSLFVLEIYATRCEKRAESTSAHSKYASTILHLKNPIAPRVAEKELKCLDIREVFSRWSI